MDTEHPIELYPGLDLFVRHDGDTPEDQILGMKSSDRVHSLQRYIQDLDFDDEMWKEIYELTEQLTRRYIKVMDIVRVNSSRSICFTKVRVFVRFRLLTEISILYQNSNFEFRY